MQLLYHCYQVKTTTLQFLSHHLTPQVLPSFGPSLLGSYGAVFVNPAVIAVEARPAGLPYLAAQPGILRLTNPSKLVVALFRTKQEFNHGTSLLARAALLLSSSAFQASFTSSPAPESHPTCVMYRLRRAIKAEPQLARRHMGSVDRQDGPEISALAQLWQRFVPHTAGSSIGVSGECSQSLCFVATT